MGSDQESSGGGPSASQDGKPPDWADGLKQLYDSVVDEPLPDAFKDLLEKLDDNDPADGASSDGAS